MINFFIDQHGCAKNQVDGELICSRLSACGYTQTFDAQKADIIIINSCGFIESAKKESLDAVYAAKYQNPNAKILLAGCLAERYADVFKTELPEADAIFGNGDIAKIDEVVAALTNNKSLADGKLHTDEYISKTGQQVVLKPEQRGVCAGKRTHFLSYRGAAFVKTTEGCSNHCTFCAIPIIRGELRSRPAKEIIAEIKQLLAQGFYEINLIGQDLAAYGTGDSDDVYGDGKSECNRSEMGKTSKVGAEKKSALAHLLDDISALQGDFRVRLLYIHPDHFNRDILPIIKRDNRIAHYFDIPFQSGSDKIIHAMNRKGTATEYKRLIDDIRAVLPDAAIRTTFLTGFPSESEEDALQTKEFLKSIQSDWSGCFTYSREEDTPAYDMKKRVPQKIAKARADELQKLQSEITAKRLRQRTGKEYDVLIEEVVNTADASENADDNAPDDASDNLSGGASDNNTNFAIARAWFQAPEVDGNIVVRFDADDKEAALAIKSGNVVRVFADRENGIDLEARFIKPVHVASITQDVTNNIAKNTQRLYFAPEESE